MGKKQRDKNEAPNPNSAANRDIIQRLNFLYQASVYLNSVGAPAPSTSSRASGEKQVKGKRKENGKSVMSIVDLSRSYIKSMKVVGQKTTVKMDPSVKRTLCKGCDIVLIPGSTAIVRVKSLPSHRHAVTYTCLSCNTCRRTPAPPTLLSRPDASILEPSDILPSPSQHSIPLAQISEAMDIDILETINSRQKVNKRNKKKKKTPPVPRLPPLFGRDVGHVMFRGNERLEE